MTHHPAPPHILFAPDHDAEFEKVDDAYASGAAGHYYQAYCRAHGHRQATAQLRHDVESRRDRYVGDAPDRSPFMVWLRAHWSFFRLVWAAAQWGPVGRSAHDRVGNHTDMMARMLDVLYPRHHYVDVWFEVDGQRYAEEVAEHIAECSLTRPREEIRHPRKTGHDPGGYTSAMLRSVRRHAFLDGQRPLVITAGSAWAQRQTKMLLGEGIEITALSVDELLFTERVRGKRYTRVYFDNEVMSHVASRPEQIRGLLNFPWEAVLKYPDHERDTAAPDTMGVSVWTNMTAQITRSPVEDDLGRLGQWLADNAGSWPDGK